MEYNTHFIFLKSIYYNNNIDNSYKCVHLIHINLNFTLLPTLSKYI